MGDLRHQMERMKRMGIQATLRPDPGVRDALLPPVADGSPAPCGAELFPRRHDTFVVQANEPGKESAKLHPFRLPSSRLLWRPVSRHREQESTRHSSPLRG